MGNTSLVSGNVVCSMSSGRSVLHRSVVFCSYLLHSAGFRSACFRPPRPPLYPSALVNEILPSNCSAHSRRTLATYGDLAVRVDARLSAHRHYQSSGQRNESGRILQEDSRPGRHRESRLRIRSGTRRSVGAPAAHHGRGQASHRPAQSHGRRHQRRRPLAGSTLQRRDQGRLHLGPRRAGHERRRPGAVDGDGHAEARKDCARSRRDLPGGRRRRGRRTPAPTGLSRISATCWGMPNS